MQGSVNSCDILKKNCPYSVIVHGVSTYHYRQHGEILRAIYLAYDLRIYYGATTWENNNWTVTKKAFIIKCQSRTQPLYFAPAFLRIVLLCSSNLNSFTNNKFTHTQLMMLLFVYNFLHNQKEWLQSVLKHYIAFLEILMGYWMHCRMCCKSANSLKGK